MNPQDDDRLTNALSFLALALLSDHSLKDDLERLTRTTCRLIERCSGASVSMLIDGAPTTVAVTDRVALELDLKQYEASDGPCVTALGGEAIRIGFIPGQERFPHFASGAADRRILSVMSTPCIDHGAVVGSLNLYGRVENAFDEQDRHTAVIMAAEVAHALVKSAALSTAHSIRDQLQEHHDERALVAQAQGVLIALHDCSAAQAKDLIRLAADQNAEPLISTAERILATVGKQSSTEARVED